MTCDHICLPTSSIVHAYTHSPTKCILTCTQVKCEVLREILHRSNTAANYAVLLYVSGTTCAVGRNSSAPYSSDALHAVARIMSGVGQRYATLIGAIYNRYGNVATFATSNLPAATASMAVANPATRTGNNGDDAPLGFSSIGSTGNFSTCDNQPVRW